MILLKLTVYVVLVKATQAACSSSSWLTSFDSAGQSMCNEIDYFIRGFERSYFEGDHSIYRLEGVQCCSAPSPWSDMELQVVYQDWTHELDRENQWVHCPSGYFLQGLQRSDGQNLGNIEAGRCIKPATHPHIHNNDCYQEDISNCFDRAGLCSCREDYFVTGLYRSNCDNLQCLDKIECCKMADQPEELDEVSKVKTRIMDATLSNMANLAHMLGYGWCSGCMSSFVGEDFYRDGDTWRADQHGNCNGYKSDHRLSLAFSDWSFAVKGIKYGESVIDSIQPATIDTGVIYNKESQEVKETFEVSETITETITHSTTSSWSKSEELGLTLNFQIPAVFTDGSITYTTSFEYSSSTTDEKSTLNSKTFTKTTEKTLAPFSAAKYRVIVSKTRTTVPYTATIIAKFSTEFRGFLRWDGGYGSRTTNYHYKYKGSEGRPTFNYRFGIDSETFYTSLKKESSSRSRPWLWHEMKQNYPGARHIINRLTDENLYEFTLTGKLEHVAGTRIEVLWDAANLTKREMYLRSETSKKIVKGIHFVKPGPEDNPALIKYPKVSLVNAEPYQSEPRYVENKFA